MPSFLHLLQENMQTDVYNPETGLVEIQECLIIGLLILTTADVTNHCHLMTMEDNLKFSKHKEIKGKESYEHYDNYRCH